MLTRQRIARNRRSLAGEVDVLDLCLGIGLALGVPFLCLVGQRILEPRLPEDPFALGGTPKIDRTPDEEEVTSRWQHAEEIFSNGKGYARAMGEQSDPYLRDNYRQWAMKALSKSKVWYEELEKLIVEAHDSQARSRFASHLEQIAARKREIDPEVDRLRQLDVHKRPDE